MSPAQADQRIPQTFAFREFVYGIPTAFVVREHRPRSSKRVAPQNPWHPLPGMLISMRVKPRRIAEEEFA